MNFNEIYQENLNIFNDYLQRYFSVNDSIPSIIHDAVKYSVFNGGKRVRPVLCISLARSFGVDIEKILPHALAIEFIHSYSLVHDDLPSMDNDDYRRGKLSTHKKFGEAIGVLTGDALLNLAFETVLNKSNFDLLDAKALKILAEYSGYTGMIKGQVLDLEGENTKNYTKESLYEIIINKTSKLITAPLLIASVLSENKYFDTLKEYGFSLGYLFQITDDIFDVTETLETIGKTPKKDQDKITAVNVFGLEGAKAQAKIAYENCLSLLSDKPELDFLRNFTDYIYNRKN